jgi:hypothetical protein
LTGRTRQGFLAIAACAAALAWAGPTQAAVTPTITAQASNDEIVFGKSITISGTLSATPAAAQTVSLQVSPYPYSAWQPVTTTTTESNGSYHFDGVKPDRNSHYMVSWAGPPPTDSAPVPITVDEKVSSEIAYQSLGRARIRIKSEHPSDLAWGDRRAYWYVAEGSSKVFKRVRINRTKQGSGGVTKLSATFQVPGGRFRFFECFAAPDSNALGVQEPSGRCHHGRDFTDSDDGTGEQLEAGFFHGRGSGPIGFPFPSRVTRAASYLNARSGYTGFAVMDSEGRLGGVNIHRTFVSASVVKAMLLVAYLRHLSAHHQGLDSWSHDTLYNMIHVSDNSAATSIWRRVGDKRLDRLALDAHMTDFSIVGIWANAQISPADQARFFFEINDLLPNEFRSFARSLLAHIVSYQSWGIPHVARPRWRVLFKGGWRSTGRGQLVHQVARLERHHATFSMAVMTDGDPTMGYGISTIEGVTARLTGGRTPQASKATWLGPGG